MVPTKNSDAPPIDLGRLAIIAATDQEKAAVLALFFRLAEEASDTLANAQHNNAFLQWKYTAHSCKGSAANMGMHTLARHYECAEKGAHLPPAQRSELLHSIREELRCIRQYIESHHAALLDSAI